MKPDLSDTIDERFSAGKGAYSARDLASEENAGASLADDANDVAAAERAGWKTSVDGASGGSSAGSQKVTLRSRFAGMSRRKKGAFGGIVALIIGGGGLLGTLFSPGFGVVHMQEVFTKDLDDISAGLEEHGVHVFKGRINASPATKGYCGSKVTVRCKFTSTSARQIRMLEKAGITVECDGVCDRKVMRNRVTAYTLPDGTRITNAAQFAELMRKNPRAAHTMTKIFNARFFAVSSKSAAKAFKLRGLDKGRKLKGDSKEKIRDSLNKSVNSKGQVKTVNGIVVTEETDADGNKIYKDANGVEYDQSKLDTNGKFKTALDSVKGSRGFAGAVKGVGIVGTVDSACTIYQTSRMVSLLAKAVRHQRLMVFALAFLNTASAIRAGTATPEEVSYVGEKLNEVDMREYVGTDDSGNGIPNPGYKQSATSSPLYRLSQFGDVPSKAGMGTSVSSFTVGGSGAGILNDIYQGAKAAIGGSPRQVCGVVQHPLTRAGSILVGILSIGTGVGAVKMVATIAGGAVVTEIAMSYLMSMINEQAEDIDLDHTARYGDFSAAMFAGTGGVYEASGRGVGARPRTSDPAIAAYAQFRNESDARYEQMMIADARRTPFDLSNQYTFLGQLVRQTSALSLGGTSALGKVMNVVRGSVASITKPASAKTDDPSRFELCDDVDYEELGIKADVMCNVRYGWTAQEMQFDNTELVEYMVDSGYIDDNAAEEADLSQVAKKDTKFAEYVTYCVDRTDPWGEQGGEDDTSDWVTGKNCVGGGSDLDAGTLSRFSAFAARYSIVQSMDYGPGDFGDSDGSTSGDNSTVSGELVGDKAYPVANGTHAGTYAGHHGVDFPLPQGSPIYAVADGTVTYVGKESYGANVIFIMHEGGIMTQYAHMHDGAGGMTVNVGDTVEAGRQIGEIGSTGMSTGPHLHFEVSLNVPDGTTQMWSSTTAPYRWLKANNIAPGPLHLGCGDCGGPILEDDFHASGAYTN
ncbi:MAG: M23 family metallopeptidase [Leucobacter sp.]